MRILIAGVLGGLAMFIWSAVAHLALPLAEIGVSRLPNEAATRAALQATVGDREGLYVFPYGPSAPQGPSGFLVYNAGNVLGLSPPTLVGEFAEETLESLIAAVLVGMAALAGYWRRVGFVALVGVAGVLTTNVSYWLWYRFPADYTLAYMFTDFVGYVAAGLVIAALVRPRISSAVPLAG